MYFDFDDVVVLISFVVVVFDVEIELVWFVIVCFGFRQFGKLFLDWGKGIGIGCGVGLWCLVNWMLVNVDYFVEMFEVFDGFVWCRCFMCIVKFYCCVFIQCFNCQG